MVKIHEKREGDTYFAEDYVESYEFILNNMLKLGIDTGSVTNQHSGSFWIFVNGASAGSISNMTYGAGSYSCNNSAPLQCLIQTDPIHVDYSTDGSNALRTVTHYWSFDKYGPDGNSGVGSDLIGSNHASTITDITRTDDGIVEQGIILNGTTSYIEVTNPITSLESVIISMTAWVKPQSLPAAGTRDVILATLGGTETFGGGLDGGFELSIESTGSLMLGIDDLGSTNSGALDIPIGSWTHVAFTASGDTATMYINGSVAGSRVNGLAVLISNGSPIQFGRYDGTAGSFFTGSMDDIGYWKGTVLSQSQIQRIYNDGKGRHLQDFPSDVTSFIGSWNGSFSSDTTIEHSVSFNGGTTYTVLDQGTLGSIVPNTGSIISRLTITRTASDVLDTVTSIGLYYG